MPLADKLKPPPDRLYGRARGHTLRARQAELLLHLLPRLRWPDQGFPPTIDDIWLEVGAGSFEHAETIASQNPTIGLIACEVFENGIASLLSRLAPVGGEGSLLKNLRVYAGDARALIRELPDCSIGRAFLMFPDPWPKARHTKRRFVHPMILYEMARIMRGGGVWRIASDDPTYQGWVDEIFSQQSEFSVRLRSMVKPADWPTTRYEAKAIASGRRPLYWQIERR